MLSAVKATNKDGTAQTITTTQRASLGSIGSQHGIAYPESVKPKPEKVFRADSGDQPVVTSAQGRRYSNKVRRDDVESIDSAGSDQMIIRKTRDWSIQYEDDNQPQRDASRPPRQERSSEDVVPARPSV